MKYSLSSKGDLWLSMIVKYTKKKAMVAINEIRLKIDEMGARRLGINRIRVTRSISLKVDWYLVIVFQEILMFFELS